MYEIRLIPLEKLRVSKYNVRRFVDKEAVRKLMLNIRENGLLNPLIVIEEDGGYGIVCGRMRFEALKLLKQEYPEDFERHFRDGIPCVVRDLTPRQAVLLSLSENVRQNTMRQEEIAQVIDELRENYGLSEEEIMQSVQLASEELARLISLARTLKSLKTEVLPGPGRPRKVERKETPKRRAERRAVARVEAVEEARPLSRTAIAILDSVSEQLERSGRVGRKFRDRVISRAKGLSIKEVQLLARRLKESVNPEEDLDVIVEEIKSARMVDRLVSLREDIVKRITEIARREGKTFDETLNEILEKALKILYKE